MDLSKYLPSPEGDFNSTDRHDTSENEMFLNPITTEPKEEKSVAPKSMAAESNFVDSPEQDSIEAI